MSTTELMGMVPLPIGGIPFASTHTHTHTHTRGIIVSLVFVKVTVFGFVAIPIVTVTAIVSLVKTIFYIYLQFLQHTHSPRPFCSIHPVDEEEFGGNLDPLFSMKLTSAISFKS
jgi:purine-cytosine permease-like protein